MSLRLRPTSPSRFKTLLGNQRVLNTYFQTNLKRFFSRATELVTIEATHKAALSTSSYLTRMVLTVREGRSVVKKHVRGNSIDRDTYHIFRRLHQRTTPFYRSPKTLAYFGRPGYIFYEEVAGETLRQLPWQASAYTSTMGHIGAALAAFQQTPISGLRKIAWDTERLALHGMATNIARISPRRAAWAQQILSVLLKTERSAWKSSHGLLHRDFQASNIILGKPIGLIDFTLSGVGPKAFDLGTYFAHLRVMSLDHVSTKIVDHRLAAFMRGYQGQIGTTAWKNIVPQLPVFSARAAFDILSITLTYLGDRSTAGKRYGDFLVHMINALIHDFPVI